MPRPHPFAPPPSPPADLAAPLLAGGSGAFGAQRLHRVAAARRGVEAAINASLCGLFLVGTQHAVWWPTILASVLAIRTTLSLHSALDDNAGLRAMSVVAMFLPLVNLGAMAVLCGRATRHIRAHANELAAFDPLRR